MVPIGTALGYCALNWIVPGVGFLAAGDRKRGIPLVIILNVIFFGGLLYGGYLYTPAFHPRSEQFNIVSALTFVVQACHGGGTVLLLGAEKVGGPLAGLLVRDPASAYSDLGSFHFLVAGALNYFATVKLFDLLTGRDHPEPAPQGLIIEEGKEGGS